MKVSVKVTTKQDDDAPSSFTAEGEFEYGEDACVIKYSEPNAELAGTVSTLTVIKDKNIVLEREGSWKCRLEFVPNSVANGFYLTPYGQIQISTHASEISNKLTHNGGTLYFSYELQDMVKCASILLEIEKKS